MAGISGKQVGFITTLYMDALISTKDEANLSAAAVSGKQIVDVTEMSTGLTKERDVIDVATFGSDVASKITGMAQVGTFDFAVAYNNDDANHLAIRDDSGLTQKTFILKMENGAAITYASFDGYVASASIDLAVDSVVSMNCSVARTGDVTYVDAA